MNSSVICSRLRAKLREGRGTHGDGADPAGLGAHDAAGGAQAPLDVIVQDELSHLRGLPAARLAADHRHAVAVDQPHQLLAHTKTKQFTVLALQTDYCRGFGHLSAPVG